MGERSFFGRRRVASRHTATERPRANGNNLAASLSTVSTLSTPAPGRNPDHSTNGALMGSRTRETGRGNAVRAMWIGRILHTTVIGFQTRWLRFGRLTRGTGPKFVIDADESVSLCFA